MWSRVPIVLLMMTGSAELSGCRRAGETPALVSNAEVRAIIDRHCTPCHSERPSIPAFPIAPGGVELDTLDQLRRYAERIRARTVLDKTMPLLNKTGMTDAERARLDRWLQEREH